MREPEVLAQGAGDARLELDELIEVTVDDVRGALQRQGLDEDSLRPGDALLFRYGWSTLWNQPDKYNDSPAGIGLEVARWVVERKATMIGSDSWAGEVAPSPDPQRRLSGNSNCACPCCRTASTPVPIHDRLGSSPAR